MGKILFQVNIFFDSVKFLLMEKVEQVVLFCSHFYLENFRGMREGYLKERGLQTFFLRHSSLAFSIENLHKLKNN